MATIGTGRSAGWLYWVISVLAVLWNAFGCLDFTMTVTRNAAYLSQVPTEIIDWLDSAPSWTLVPWALGTWGALLGSLLLLARSRHAVTAFIASLVGLAISQAWQFSAGMPPSMTTPGMLAMTAMIWVIELGLLWFAWAKRRDGVLR